jgi:O-antigen biosynthesis protein
MTFNEKFGGSICWDDDEFVNESISLYQDEQKWNQKKSDGYEVLENLFHQENNLKILKKRLIQLKNEINIQRSQDIYQRILFDTSMRITEIKSKSIIEKNQKK